MKKLFVALSALLFASAVYAGGYYTTYPQLGNTANTTCTSFGNNGVCNQYQPLGPSYLQGNETFLVDSNYSNNQPSQFTIPMTALAGGYGGITASSTTGTTALVQVADGISTYIYSGAGAATYTSFKFPNNPINGQRLCLSNAGSGVLTLSAVAAGTNIYGNTPTVTGVTPTSLPVMTAVGTAGTVTGGENCWAYVAGASNTGVWYRTE